MQRALLTFANRHLHLALLASGCLLPGMAGCGPPMGEVRGTVTFADGKPLTNGFVVFELKEGDPMDVTQSRGRIGPDGTFIMNTEEADDGVPEGTYTVTITDATASLPDGTERPLIHAKFDDPEKSGLEITVAGGETQNYNITVEPP